MTIRDDNPYDPGTLLASAHSTRGMADELIAAATAAIDACRALKAHGETNRRRRKALQASPDDTVIPVAVVKSITLHVHQPPADDARYGRSLSDALHDIAGGGAVGSYGSTYSWQETDRPYSVITGPAATALLAATAPMTAHVAAIATQDFTTLSAPRTRDETAAALWNHEMIAIVTALHDANAKLAAHLRAVVAAAPHNHTCPCDGGYCTDPACDWTDEDRDRLVHELP